MQQMPAFDIYKCFKILRMARETNSAQGCERQLFSSIGRMWLRHWLGFVSWYGLHYLTQEERDLQTGTC